MKAEIHPKLNHVVFVDSSCGAEFATLSTMSAKTTKKINGVDHYVISVDISSASHPFYTGKQTLIDTAGRVDKFRARAAAAKKMQEGAKASKRPAIKNTEVAEKRALGKLPQAKAGRRQAVVARFSLSMNRGEHSTFNIERSTSKAGPLRTRWMFDVEC